MILQFSVSNYKAFRERQTLNFAASKSDKSLEENLLSPDLPGLKNQRWLKGVGIYGANASGKSTVIEALKTLSKLVEDSAKTTDPWSPIPGIEPFALDPTASKEPTAFSLVFVNEGVRYEYRLAATSSLVWHESLRSFPKGAERLWFIRNWSESEEKHIFTPESPSGMARNKDIESRTLSNMLYLSKAIAENRSELAPVFQWITNHLRFLDLGARTNLDKAFTIHKLQSNDPEKSEAILDLLRHADIGIAGANIYEDDIDEKHVEMMRHILSEKQFAKFTDEKQMTAELLHSTADGSALALPWKSESTGTQRLFALTGPWLDILENGYTVCIDELETSLHPHIVRELLKIFYSAEHNPNNAQLIFTTHNPLLLDTNSLMRRDQIWLTDKDRAGKSHLYPLTDYKPRKGESLVRGYMAGRYGGVPFIPNGLLGDNPPQTEEVSGE